MSLSTLLMVSAMSFLLFHVWEKRWRHKGATSIAQAGFRSAVEYLRSVALIATLVYALLLGTVAVAALLTPVTVADLAVAIQELQELRTAIAGWSSYWSSAVLVLLVVGMTAFVYRRGANRWAGRARDYWESQLRTARAERASQASEALPPSPEMERLLAVQHELQRRLRELSSASPEHRQPAAMAKLETALTDVTTELDRLDLVRRVEPFRDEPNGPSDTVELQSRSSAIMTFLISRGLLSTLDRGSRLVLTSTLALLCISLVAVSGRAAANAVDVNVIVGLEALYLERSEQSALASYARVIPEGSAPSEVQSAKETDVSEQDEEALDYLAAEFERAVGRALAVAATGTAGSAAGGAALHRLRARQGIVRAAAHSGQSTRTATLTSLADSNQLDRMEREAVALFEGGADGQAPQTDLGRRFRRDLEEQQTRRAPDMWTDIRQRARQAMTSFRQPATAQEFESRVLSQIFGKAIGLGGPSADELSILARELVNRTGSSTVQRIYTVARAQAFDNLVNSETTQEAFERLVAQQTEQWRTSRGLAQKIGRVTERVPRSQDVVETLARDPPGLRVDNELAIDRDRLTRVLQDYNRIGSVSLGGMASPQVPEAIVEFDDYFPSNADGGSGTVRQQLSAGFGGREAGGASAASVGARSVARSSERAFARARSFGRLRGFSRIGGVLIGRPPADAGRRLDLRSLDWSEFGVHHVTLRLTDARGTVFEVGTFSRALVHQALAYAADGRPVAVTMTTAAPLTELRILLHPALVDTPLGCRIIELDRFVDEFTAEDDARREMEEFVRGQGALYKVAWAQRLISAPDRGLLRAPYPENVQAALGEASGSSLRALAAVALERAELLEDPTYSVLAAKQDHFDPELVGVIGRCGRERGSLEDFESCVREERARGGRALRGWLEPPPEFTIWSGVREGEYNLDAEFGFLEAGEGVLAPLEFMLQVAFVDSEEEDLSPWEFPSLSEDLAATVAAGVRGSERHQEILETAREFTILQRLFRAALDGALGDEFPVRRMVELASGTAGAVRHADTLRWNVRAGALEFSLAIDLIAVLERVDPGSAWQREMVADMLSCVTFIEREDYVTAVDGATWREECGFGRFRTESVRDCRRGDGDDNACYFEMAAILAEEAVVARELRAALGVVADEDLAGSACPPMIELE